MNRKPTDIPQQETLPMATMSTPTGTSPIRESAEAKPHRRNSPCWATNRPAALAALAMVLSAPLPAQEGRDLLNWEEPLQARSEHLLVQEAGDLSVVGPGDISLVDTASSDPTGIPSAATTEYRYDDRDTNTSSVLRTNAGDVHEQEFAQRFRLNGSGTVSYVVLCVARREGVGNSNRLPFKVTFYRDSGGRPGSALDVYEGAVTSPSAGAAECFRLAGALAGQRLSSGNTWLGVSWLSSTGMAMMVDDRATGNTRLSVRAKVNSNSNWIAWQDHPTSSVRVFLIRLGVDHGGGTPDPDPDPPPPPTSGCTPTTTALQFDGGYKVSMCYRTPQGAVGQARSGIWASGQAGLLWFFDRGNAEVLVKVLDGCSHNGHRWVYVAPVTDLEFNLWVTGPGGRRWTHSNRQGTTASAKSDTRAFSCADEGAGDDDDGDGGDGSSAPDLVVSSPSASNGSPSAGGSFTFRATVRNQGNANSAATTLRYYRSSNPTINSSDTQVGTDPVGALGASGSSAESIGLRASSSAGTYYYGACVDSVSSESNTGNNCSSAVRITVNTGGGNGGGGDDGGSGGACRAGLVVNPGGSCTYKGHTFRVGSDGRGSIAFFSSSNSIDSRGGTVNGVRWNFYASRNAGSNSWTIHVAD